MSKVGIVECDNRGKCLRGIQTQGNPKKAMRLGPDWVRNPLHFQWNWLILIDSYAARNSPR